MGYGNSVQFFGKKAVLDAFINSDCSNWSVMQAKQFMFKYEGTSQAEARDNLESLLKMISESSASDATYTLRVYDMGDEPIKAAKPGQKKPIDKKRKIYESTDFDGSFNFKLFQGAYDNPRQLAYTENQELKTELAALKQLVAEMQKERDEEPEEKIGGIAGTLNALLDTPEIKAAVIGKVLHLFNHVSNKVGSYMSHEPVAKIAGPVAEVSEKPIELPQEKVNLLNTALTTLVKLDPSFPDHLYKLAMVAQKNPALYQNLITMLNNMQ